MSTVPRRKRTDSEGRAYAGSQLQLQLYVDRHRGSLDAAIVAAIGIDGDLSWVSPVRETKFREFKDRAFLEAVGLQHLSHELSRFWPASGPRWDGLACVIGKRTPTLVLVEAKNYPREVRGGGCKASDVNNARETIHAALRQTASELGIENSQHWMGALYQYANRVAHAQFLRRFGVDAYMVNVCFFDDPHPSRHTTEKKWRAAALALKKEMGLVVSPEWLADVFLPAADGTEFFESNIR